ncbi:sugar ABC transporter permease [Euzebya sp.]|uniref:sugar ABC transporter permease n=1 Tax=Euzebya sp. TaxID=1971409 RepID=UPI003515F841
MSETSNPSQQAATEVTDQTAAEHDTAAADLAQDETASELAEAAGEREIHRSDATVGDYARAWFQRVKAGDLGNLPIIIGLLVITVVFTSLNERFLSSINFVNLIVQTSPFVVIAIGAVFVLAIAEVDLSVGYLSGVSMVVAARLLGEEAWPFLPTFLAVLAVGLFAGFVHGWFVAKLGLPSLIVTLAALVGYNGLVLILIGGRGTIVIQDATVISIANRYLPAALSYGLVAASVAAFAAVQLTRRARRSRADLETTPLSIIVIKVAALLVGGLAAVYFAYRSRGVPMIAVILLVLLVAFTIVLMRTGFGRHVYAVGGNPEAARRAGISVDRVRIAAFMISGAMAAMGGLVFASRLRSVDTGSGGGQIELNVIAAVVIGGVSLFGGRGKVSAALFGSLVIVGVDNGMGLLGLSSGAKFVVTAVVLLLAVLVDAVARRGRTRSGVA